ncbi:MAG: hypothetical protein IT416_00665 [Candidatus Pacebacteria bacterium]|nr:hypothetical protein [Candidatus Paceibacterota bacterium]
MIEEESLNLFPDEVKKALASHEMVVFCWACEQVLYEADKIDAVTSRVAYESAVGHEDAYTTEDHQTDVFRKGDELVN